MGRVGVQVGAVNSLDLGIIGGEIGKTVFGYPVRLDRFDSLEMNE